MPLDCFTLNSQGKLYDKNTNTDCHLIEIENILEDMEAHNGLIVGGDFNTITKKVLGQKDYSRTYKDKGNTETKRMGNHKEVE